MFREELRFGKTSSVFVCSGRSEHKCEVWRELPCLCVQIEMCLCVQGGVNTSVSLEGSTCLCVQIEMCLCVQGGVNTSVRFGGIYLFMCSDRDVFVCSGEE